MPTLSPSGSHMSTENIATGALNPGTSHPVRTSPIIGARDSSQWVTHPRRMSRSGSVPDLSSFDTVPVQNTTTGDKASDELFSYLEFARQPSRPGSPAGSGYVSPCSV